MINPIFQLSGTIKVNYDRNLYIIENKHISGKYISTIENINDIIELIYMYKEVLYSKKQSTYNKYKQTIKKVKETLLDRDDIIGIGNCCDYTNRHITKAFEDKKYLEAYIIYNLVYNKLIPIYLKKNSGWHNSIEGYKALISAMINKLYTLDIIYKYKNTNIFLLGVPGIDEFSGIK